ncbi:MAG TPA: FAD-dependent oxidoreductase [Pseudomonas sp.]|uniref:FAD-dependent oxidoreductase n=1 Tax=Pseudomonas sp. TaxID=306 RepID=UPI002ED83EC8
MRFSDFDTSLWYATAAAGMPPPALNERLESEVCIVGGGYTGLTTALELSRSGVERGAENRGIQHGRTAHPIDGS